MTEDTTPALADLIDRLGRGEPDAKRRLLERAHHRLVRIAAAIFQQDFPGLRGRHDLESVVSETWLRLIRSLETIELKTVDDFYGLVFVKVRQVLLDMARREKRAAVPIGNSQDEREEARVFDCADTTHDPARLALLSEFHDQVRKLDDDKRQVFELTYYGGLTQIEIAQLMGIHRRKVSRLWIAATEQLATWAEDLVL
jgi:RNA polymerase sigma factor (sigma-70 family)